MTWAAAPAPRESGRFVAGGELRRGRVAERGHAEQARGLEALGAALVVFTAVERVSEPDCTTRRSTPFGKGILSTVSARQIEIDRVLLLAEDGRNLVEQAAADGRRTRSPRGGELRDAERIERKAKEFCKKTAVPTSIAAELERPAPTGSVEEYSARNPPISTPLPRRIAATPSA